MDTTIKTSSLAVVGDIHGEFTSLVWEITSHRKITDTTFILAGDCGIGFDKSLKDAYIRKRLGRRLEDSGCYILGVRGNHDDPKYFKEPDLIDFPRIKTLPDYTHLSWGDRKIVIIGGGVSVDREERMKSRKICWWSGERVTQDLNLLDQKEDIVISHMAPLCIGPTLLRTGDLQIWKDVKSDREYLSTVLKETRPEKWIFGHYHSSTSGDYEDCLWRGLDIMEFYEIH